MSGNSLREKEITWFEATRAYTAADGRGKVTPTDLKIVALMALRLRRSQCITKYYSNQEREETEIVKLLSTLEKKRETRKS